MFEEIRDDEIISKLTSFANARNKEIYLVGGVVRDALIGVKKAVAVDDVDIATTLSIDEMIEFAKKNGLSHEVKNKKLEVVAIWKFSQKVYELARLRREFYSSNEQHTPSFVEFTSSVEEDAKRRDFTINSVYYTTHSNEIIDPVGGAQDVINKRLRTVRPPEETLAVDPARIIRLVELAARFDLEVDDHTMNIARQQAKNVSKLSFARKEKELDRLRLENKYGENGRDYKRRVMALAKGLELDLSNFGINWQ